MIVLQLCKYNIRGDLTMKTSKVITTILLATSLIGATAVTTTIFVTPTTVVSWQLVQRTSKIVHCQSHMSFTVPVPSDQSTGIKYSGVTDNYTKLTTTGADAANLL